MNYGSVIVADRWDVRMPQERIEAINWAKWERCRFESMAANLEHGDVLYDVGTEWADVSAVYAQIVGPENMVLMEPHPQTWTIIKRTWEENGYAKPKGCWPGLVGANNNGIAPAPAREGWPECAYGDLWPHRSYRYIHEHVDSTPMVSVAGYMERCDGEPPTAITIDVEGAELQVLKGMGELLEWEEFRPLIWCSVHPDLLQRDYKARREELFWFIREYGYWSRLLGVDHEEHWLFWPEERQEPK